MQFDPVCVARMHTSAEEHAHICTVGVPVQIFPPLDILPPAFLEEHVLGEMSEEGCVCVWWLLAALPPHCKRGWFPTGYDLGQGQAAGPGPQLC